MFSAFWCAVGPYRSCGVSHFKQNDEQRTIMLLLKDRQRTFAAVPGGSC